MGNSEKEVQHLRRRVNLLEQFVFNIENIFAGTATPDQLDCLSENGRRYNVERDKQEAQ